MKISVLLNQPRAWVLGRLLWENSKATCLLLLMTALMFLSAMAQNNITVRGRITDEKSQPVVGASIVVKGTANGTTTNNNGEYQLSVPANGTFVVSSVGYPTK